MSSWRETKRPPGLATQQHGSRIQAKVNLRWPKMDLTNIRSMELFRKLGLADELRKQGEY